MMLVKGPDGLYTITPKHSVGETVSWRCDDGQLLSGVVKHVDKSVTSAGAKVQYHVESTHLGEAKMYVVDSQDVLPEDE